MSNSKMLIDATHPEETRVVVVRGGRVEEFDYESAARKLLRGNIYLAKVTRVEPSLQAAFIDYGGNRHGFLAFNEIHPDYYQIPVADRQALLEEEAQAEAEEEAAVDARAESMSHTSGSDEDADGDDHGSDNGGGRGRHHRRDRRGRHHHRRSEARAARHDETVSEQPSEAPEAAGEISYSDQPSTSDDTVPAAASEPEHHVHHEADHDAGHDAQLIPATPPPSDSDEGEGGVHEVDAGGTNGEAEAVEEVQTEQDALEEVPTRPRRRMRSYKIQEVIKRRQIVLVQVVKEERGNKGAALTTYLSLAGRYTVLMPNTARGGGISRKITNPSDRKRLKAIAHELEVPEGMGLIIRTAGAARTKQEIKRDFEYLLRLWESVRELTLESTAPSLVYEEGNLIKRSIRDHFTKDVDEVVVAGEEAHHEAFDFMRMLMPTHAKNVINYKDPEPLFARFRVEQQLSAMFSPFVTLRSGGYLVINQTEALVAIDINSGKSTREFSIEETALNTNLEAADEIARQLKLRDLAGLIVIDFIDMEEKRNNRAVERRIKDALRFDRARIQIGRISHFGLLEMSRQRLRTGVLEGSTTQCPHCQGTGIVRSTESVALAVLRGIEDALMSNPRAAVMASTTAPVAIYILNSKRAYIVEMEARYGVPITIQASDKLHGANFNIERSAAPAQIQRRPERQVVNMDWGFDGESEAAVEEADAEPEVESDITEVGAPEDDDLGEAGDGDEENGHDNGRRGRRRRRRRGRRGDRDMEMGGERAEGGERRDHGEHREPREHRGHRDHRGPREHREHRHPHHHARGHDEGAPVGLADTPADVPRYTSYAELAADIANGGDGAGIVVAPPAPRYEDRGHGQDWGDRERRGRRRGRRGGRRGRDFDNRNGVQEGAAEAPGLGDQPSLDSPALAGTGPQPDVSADFPGEAAPGGEGHHRGRDRWRNRRNGNWRDGDQRRDGQRFDRDRRPAGPSPAALIAASIDAALSPPAIEPQPAEPIAAAPARPTVAPVETTPAAAPEPQPVAAEPVAEAAPAAPARPRRSLETSSEPKIERVVMRPDQVAESAGDGSAPPAAPARKGWWQRRFGSSA